MNHCLLEVTVKVAPTIRYTQDNQTAIAEMDVEFDGFRADDPPGSIKVVGWGNLAQDLQSHVQIGQRLIIEGRLRMNTVPRQDGSKEKRAEFTLSKIHSSTPKGTISPNKTSPNQVPSNDSPSLNALTSKEPENPKSDNDSVTWNSSPLIPDTDDIPF
ncbi:MULTISPECIES: single-stranded DNA-binding protein [unclassified Prochlorococcus]|uniref:single-stranded DNA-binding protein n=1 Tax=unclassified Prochlorococcus TaxID=2627481 RepID=UPI000533A88C|nr:MULTISPECIES: single-stranded DNA-binding protein [unclassified Prochlorococcus]KGG16457.1 Single-stranded DNA-binding protein [Prochlorococcus sp. MIT 0602]KGG17069.1 Single-stranded DNA-binding protein [Prochlorococcus sp. MIT 0603]